MLCLERHAVVGTWGRGVCGLLSLDLPSVLLTGPPNFMFFKGKGKGTGLNGVVRRSVKLLSGAL